MEKRMKRIIAFMLIGILLLCQSSFLSPVEASQTETGVTTEGETATEAKDIEATSADDGTTETSSEEITTEAVASEEIDAGVAPIADEDDATTEESDEVTAGLAGANARLIGGTNTNVPITEEPEEIDPKSYVPYNRLRILAPSEITDSSSVDISVEDISGWDGKNESEKWHRVSYNNNKSYDAVYHGSWNEAKEYIYASFEGEYDAISVQFCGSDTRADENTYRWYALCGWTDGSVITNSDGTTEDTINYYDIDETPMWIKVKYKGSVTYDGKPVICIATLKVTPFKNRTSGYNDDDKNKSYNNQAYIWDNYYPTLQISELLYNGWVWQNVKDCQATLEFYYDTGEEDNEDTEKDEELGDQIKLEQTTYQDYVGSYYTINSLNPKGQGQNDDDGYWPHLYGPEYLLPQGNNNIYIVENLIVDGKELESNIQTSYSGGEAVSEGQDYFLTDWDNTGTNWLDSNDIQYAYNGGDNTWNYDSPDSPGWALNSVTVMPSEVQDSFVFSMGQLLRRKDSNSVYHTANMWASITTDSFGVMRKLIDITVKKEWLNSNGQDDAVSHASDSVSVTLYKRYTKDDGTTNEEKIATQTISKDTDWECTFKSLVPEGCLYRTIDGVSTAENAEYVVKEETFSGYEYTVEKKKSGTVTEVTNDGDPYEVVNFEFTVTNKPITGKIIISKLGVNDNALEGVTYELQKASDTWLPDKSIESVSMTTALDSDGKATCTFDNLEEGNYLITEVKTVSGYNLLAEPIKITVPYTTNDKTNVDTNIYSGYQQDGDTHCYYHITYTVKNSQYLALPESGSGLRMILQICGVVLIGTSIISYFIYRKKDKGKGDD